VLTEIPGQTAGTHRSSRSRKGGTKAKKPAQGPLQVHGNMSSWTPHWVPRTCKGYISLVLKKRPTDPRSSGKHGRRILGGDKPGENVGYGFSEEHISLTEPVQPRPQK